MRISVTLGAALLFMSGLCYGDTNAFVAKTGQTYSYCVGDDGYYQKGAAFTNVRFTTGAGTASNCVTDNLTQLMWLRNPDSTNRNWTNAITYCENLDGTNGRGGYTDWRMPNNKELLSVVDFGVDNPATPTNAPFLNIQAGKYWTSTSCNSSSADAWVVQFINGYMYNNTKSFSYYVWPVRGP